MKTDVLSFVDNAYLCAVYISHPFIFSANKHFDTFLFVQKCCVSCLEIVTTIRDEPGLRIGTTVLNPAHT